MRDWWLSLTTRKSWHRKTVLWSWNLPLNGNRKVCAPRCSWSVYFPPLTSSTSSSSCLTCIRSDSSLCCFLLFTVGGDNNTVPFPDTKLWDVIAEVIKLCMYPAALNPFAVDFKYFEGLQLVERVVATGAMVHFLQKVVTSGDHAYNSRGKLVL